MALVHQRLHRVTYVPNPGSGALGSLGKLHGISSLNHHYSVFQMSIDADELTRTS